MKDREWATKLSSWGRFETLSGMDAAVKSPGMGSRRVSKRPQLLSQPTLYLSFGGQHGTIKKVDETS